MSAPTLLRFQVSQLLSQTSRNCGSFRSFFASSTDHTTLLQSAVVHRLESADGRQQYVMAADGQDLAMVQKVPQLHLARLWREGTMLYGTKVVNTTLGTPTEVCGRLVDAALEDAKKLGEPILARSTLHGLSPWVQKALDGKGDKKETFTLSMLEEPQLKVLREIVQNGDAGCDRTVYQKMVQSTWGQLAQAFIEKGLSEEVALYESKGGVFSKVVHHSDRTEYAKTCGGAMALFSFSS